MALQKKGDIAICSSVGDIQKHEKFKGLDKEERISILQETYEKYGVRSNEFFIQVKPFIMWTAYRHLRGMSSTNLEDLVNSAYEELILAFEGGKTLYYNEVIYKEPTYGKTKHENIGLFIMSVVGCAVSKYHSKYHRRQTKYEDNQHDISERINFTNFEMENNLGYEMDITDMEYEVPEFTFFKFNRYLAHHLNVIKLLKPRNNVLYNYMLWKGAMV